jgi:hypothetical protein
MVAHLKRIARISFVMPLVPIPNLTTCPSSPAIRESIFVAISFDLLRKRRAKMDDVNVSNVREVDRMLKRRLTLAVIVEGRHA